MYFGFRNILHNFFIHLKRKQKDWNFSNTISSRIFLNEKKMTNLSEKEKKRLTRTSIVILFTIYLNIFMYFFRYCSQLIFLFIY